MRGRAIAALGLVAAALAFALLGRITLGFLLDPLAGLLLVAAACVGISLLPFWATMRGPTMPGLFTPPREGQRWCTVCGRPAPLGACPRCRTQGRRTRRQARGLQRK
ncbi:MAG TPA: hypothetical protein VM286_09190 [Candidatus Thermoplasmatota archaeon]|nr:hypothetical protein [Candidatus Thermoplasmatota archaeon]